MGKCSTEEMATLIGNVRHGLRLSPSNILPQLRCSHIHKPPRRGRSGRGLIGLGQSAEHAILCHRPLRVARLISLKKLWVFVELSEAYEGRVYYKGLVG